MIFKAEHHTSVFCEFFDCTSSGQTFWLLGETMLSTLREGLEQKQMDEVFGDHLIQGKRN